MSQLDQNKTALNKNAHPKEEEKTTKINNTHNSLRKLANEVKEKQRVTKQANNDLKNAANKVTKGTKAEAKKILEKATQENKKISSAIQTQAIKDAQTENSATPAINTYAISLLAKAKFDFTSTIDFTQNTDTIVQALTGELSLDEGENDAENIQRVVNIYLKDKVEKKIKQITNDEEKSGITVKFTSTGISFFTPKEQTDNIKIAEANTEKIKQFNNLKPYLKTKENAEFRTILTESAKVQETHKTAVKTATDESFLFTIAESFMPGLIPSLLNSNSLIGGILRSILGIPKAPTGHNPLSTLNDEERNAIDDDATTISQKILANFKKPSYKKEYQESDKKGKITTVLESEFGLPNNNVVHTASNINQEHKTHKIIISPDSKAQFSNIYSFLKSPNNNELSILTGEVHQKSNIDSNSDIVKKATEIASLAKTQTSNGLGKAALKWISAPDSNIESGHPEYSKLKGEIEFPIGYDVRTTATGNIEVAWTEERGTLKPTPTTPPPLNTNNTNSKD